ncbi:MAG TPA: DnaA regulatory inactivator Hda [Gammaproteobacteria bacterium]|nr:DnaA regulatory inactivator Hda [Gammaproteobacteria bacterium]
MKINQLTLGVGLKDEATFTNFFSGKNNQLLDVLKKAARNEGERVIYFYGIGGQGCTHLLQASCHEAARQQLSAVYIPLQNIIDLSPEIFEGLETLQLICIDDVHRLAGKPDWEEAFFHLYNRIHDAGGRLIVTANVAPKLLGLALPDVVSRLAWSIVFQLQSLSDEEKLQALMMRADRRGMTLSEEVGKFILTHCPRHMSTLFAALEALDKVSLAAQRKLTVPFVKSVLQM